MSYAQGTQFYNLPQTVGTDKRDWFDTNSAFAAVDAALHAAVTGQATDAEAISTINAKLATDEANIAALQTKGNTHDSQIAALQTTVNTQASQISDVRQDAEDMITANNEGAAATSTRAYAIGDYFIYNDVLYKATAAIAIGDTIVPNTNCEATNVDTEISQLNSDISGIGSLAFSTSVSGKSNVTIPNDLLNRNHYFVISVVLNNLVIAEFRVGGTDLAKADLVQGGYKNAQYNKYIELYGHDDNQIRINDCTINGTDESANITVYVGAFKMTK